MGDDDDEIVMICDEDGTPIEFETFEDAVRLLRAHLAPGSHMEMHAAGCDGTRGVDCDCGVEVVTESEANPRVRA